jgi:hypothetical protein
VTTPSSEILSQLEDALSDAHGAGPGEPALRYHFSNPTDIALLEDFATRHPKDVLLYQIPFGVAVKGKVVPLICEGMLRTMGQPSIHKEERLRKLDRFKTQRSARNIRMIILADAHNLSTGSRRRPLLSDFYALVSFLKSDGMPANTTVLFTGEQDVLEPLIMQDTWLIRRFSALL